jgi:hypothetical protein
VTALASWALLILGLVYVTTCSAIFAPVRMALSRNAWLKILAYCPMCQAFWFGLALTWLGLGPFHGGWLERIYSAMAAIGVVVVAKAFGGLESPWAQEQGEA